MASSASRYARAFAEVSDAESLDFSRAEQQLRDFADALESSPQLRELLENPSLEMPQKLKVLDALAPRIGMYPQVRNLLAVILEHQRLTELADILEDYHAIADARSGTTEARVTSARPLDGSARRELESQISKLAGGPIRVQYAEDASLLGGAVVEIGSTVYDGSLRTQLDQMKSRLVNA